MDDYSEIIRTRIRESMDLKKRIFADDNLIGRINDAVRMVVGAYKIGGKLVLCGNGGSAADAQHLAGEMIARFYLERKALPAIALNTNSSVVTAIGNDYEYDVIFARQVEALGNSGDVLIAISTSGNSRSVLFALDAAKNAGMRTIGFLGKGGGKCAELCEVPVIVPSDDTPRIQECHIMIGHILCELAEQEIALDS